MRPELGEAKEVSYNREVFIAEYLCSNEIVETFLTHHSVIIE